MIDPPPPPASDGDGVELEEDSGAGYGNHAPDVAQKPSEQDNDGR